MNCLLGTRDRPGLLLAYGSGKLDAAKAAFVEKHIASCEACREFVRGQQMVWEALDIWEAETVSADFNRRLYQRIEGEATWWNRFLNPLRPLAFHKGIPLAAAFCLVVFAGAILDRTAAPPPPATRAAQVAAAEGLQPEQVVNALDEMQALSRFNDLMKIESPESKM